MSFLDDAQNFLHNNRLEQQQEINTGFLETSQSRENFEKELREIYENATWNEIKKAVDWGLEVMEKPYDQQTFLKKIRVKLED